MHTPWH